MHPLSHHVTCLHEFICMIELIWSHTRLNMISEGEQPLNDVHCHNPTLKKYSIIGGVGWRYIYLTSTNLILSSNILGAPNNTHSWNCWPLIVHKPLNACVELLDRYIFIGNVKVPTIIWSSMCWANTLNSPIIHIKIVVLN